MYTGFEAEIEPARLHHGEQHKPRNLLQPIYVEITCGYLTTNPLSISRQLTITRNSTKQNSQQWKIDLFSNKIKVGQS